MNNDNFSLKNSLKQLLFYTMRILIAMCVFLGFTVFLAVCDADNNAYFLGGNIAAILVYFLMVTTAKGDRE